MLNTLIEKCHNKSVKVGIIGLGYVGLPLAEAYVNVGVSVIGYDVNQDRVDILNSGQSGMKHIDDSRVKSMVDKGLFKASSNPNVLSEVDTILIAVPTPLDIHHQPDLTYVIKTCEVIRDHMREGQLVVLESTTYPGTTAEVMKPILEQSGLKEGEDFALAYSPEREDPGNPNFNTSTIPKVVGSDTSEGLKAALAVYDLIVNTVPVKDTRTAEAAKLVENIYRWVNIATVNEMKIIFDKMGIDVWAVIDAAKTKPFGFHAFYPGPGVGGHCIRIDPYYLSYKAREFGLSTQFIELAGHINQSMPRHIVTRTLEELSLRQRKALAGSKVLLCGLAYKKDIDDMRESPSLDLISILEEHGAIVAYHDPYIPVVPTTREHPEYSGRESVDITGIKNCDYDVAIIATDHTNVDYKLLCENTPLLIDTRNALKDLTSEFKDKIVKA
ncbi:nucleotide sugar dehydrogenase [Woodsholea maritima]|uniref:nucleotide sugar dehydrogenase n=1 Tax=Woodsholea maritima TaxID=240237 RepID=UPI000361012F|nr:nucleotide sugar dehydrogenase [Woodsholea maritima]